MLITYPQANKCLEQVFGSFFTDFGDFEPDFDQIFEPDFEKPETRFSETRFFMTRF
jgi:hypothetical protein